MCSRLLERKWIMSFCSTRAVAIAFVLLWSSGWIVASAGLDDFGLYWLLTARYAVVTVALGVLLLLSRRWQPLTPRQCAPYFLVGILSHAVFLMAGVNALAFGVGVGLVAFITALQPMITAALTRPLTHERVSLREWSGLVLGLSAVLLVISEKMRVGFSATAVVLPLISVLALSLGALLQRRAQRHHERNGRAPLPLVQVMFLHVLAAFAVLLVGLVLSGEPAPELNMTRVGIILWLALVVSLGAYALMAVLLRRMSAFKVSSLTYLTPPATMMMAWLVFGNAVGLFDVIGLAIAAFGVFITLQGPKRHLVQHQPLPKEILWRVQVDIEL